MKRTLKRLFIFLAIIVSFAIIIGPAIAATPTTEPSLPADIATYQAEQVTCNKYAGKSLAVDIYRKMTENTLVTIFVFYMNGQKIDLFERTTTKDGQRTISRYVRNTPGGNWLKYSPSETEAAGTRSLTELGLTPEELSSCNE